jgi:DUF4097 and DUF4098 domain-containing protein YvlB
MPKRLGSTLLFLTLLSFPFRLLAGGVIQTENFTYPLAGNGKFTVEEANGSITISSWDRNEVAITLVLPRSADALVDAGTTVGRISSDLPATKSNKGIVGETLEAKLGAGSHHLEANTTNGSIRLEAR